MKKIILQCINCNLNYELLFQVKKEIYEAGFMCDVDVDHGDTLNKKIRNAQLAQYNFILGQCLL